MQAKKDAEAREHAEQAMETAEARKIASKVRQEKYLEEKAERERVKAIKKADLVKQLSMKTKRLEEEEYARRQALITAKAAEIERIHRERYRQWQKNRRSNPHNEFKKLEETEWDIQASLPSKWRELISNMDEAAACQEIEMTSPIASKLMPVFQSERYPTHSGNADSNGVQWSEDEHALWDYLEIVAIVSQTMFQYPHAGLTRLPLAISQLTMLEEVNLSENKLVVVPIELVSLPNLRRLFLHDNQIKAIPDMSACVNLVTLDVRSNCLFEVPAGIGSCQQLQTFDAEKNQIRDFGELTQCLELHFINLSRNFIRIVPAELAYLSKLRILRIQNNPVVNLPPHVFIQGMSSIMSYLKENTTINETSIAISSMASDILAFLNEGQDLTDMEVYATKEDSPLVLSMPYTEESDLKEIDTSKIVALLKIHETSMPIHPMSAKVHSLIMMARVPHLRDTVRQAKMQNCEKFALDISPLDLHILLMFVYSDSIEDVNLPSNEEVKHLISKAPGELNIREYATLRHSLVQHWRTRLLAVGALGKQFGLEYLETLASKALKDSESSEKPFAKSRFIDDFKTLMPTSESVTIQHDWNTDEAMKNISQGFGELSLQNDGSSPLLRSSNGIAHVPDMSSTGTDVQIDHRHGVKSLAFAPNDIAFRVVDEPGSPLIGAHKLVLCARSKYLRSMLTGGLMESQQVVIDMCDISYDTLRTIVEFCYSDDVSDIHGEMIMELLMKARLFGLDRLLGFVESIVGYSLDVSNVSSILSVAYIYSLPRLAKATKFFALSHWSQVTSDPSWQDVDVEIRKRLMSTAIKWGVISEAMP